MPWQQNAAKSLSCSAQPPALPPALKGVQHGLKSEAHVHFLYACSTDGRMLEVISDEDRAMSSRQSCIQELIKQLGNGMDWETTVDRTVIQDNVGLVTVCVTACF